MRRRDSLSRKSLLCITDSGIEVTSLRVRPSDHLRLECIERFLPSLLARELDYFSRYLFSICFASFTFI